MTIIDLSNFAYKFTSAISYKKEIAGVVYDLSVPVGFVRALRSSPDSEFLVCLDGVPQQSLNLLPSYKGQREHTVSEVVNFPRTELVMFLSQVGERLGKDVRVVCSPLQEADQVVSSVVHMLKNAKPARASFLDRINTKSIDDDRYLSSLSSASLSKYEHDFADIVIIASTDADMAQLQRFDGVFMDTSTSGKRPTNKYLPASVEGCNPFAIPVYKALFGDASDNIPSSISQSYKKALLPVLQNITSDEQAQSIYNDISMNRVVRGKFEAITSAVLSVVKGRQDFLRNWAIAYLTYYSNPFELHFPAYNIQETIDKYGLRV